MLGARSRRELWNARFVSDPPHIINHMFENRDGSAHVLSAVLAMLAGPSDCVTDPDRIDRIRLLEDVKSAGMPVDRVGRGIAAQVALARRISPHTAQRHVGWSTILTTELPATLDALTSGRTTEWRAMLVARETAWLSREHRAPRSPARRTP